jgi:hypothetical protein
MAVVIKKFFLIIFFSWVVSGRSIEGRIYVGKVVFMRLLNA